MEAKLGKGYMVIEFAGNEKAKQNKTKNPLIDFSKI